VLLVTIGFILAHSLGMLAFGIRNGTAQLMVSIIPLALAGLLSGLCPLLIASVMSIRMVVLIAFLENLASPLAGFIYSPTASGFPTSAPTIPAVAIFIVCTVLLSLFFNCFRRLRRRECLPARQSS
jgi:hypothetical protein